MPSREPYARIAITLPPSELEAADRLAAQLDRSRSWVVAEAIRRYAAEQTAVRPGADLGEFRRDQLRRDVTLSAEQRVREAESSVIPRDAISEPQTFYGYEAFEAWRDRQASSA